jgi:hypothetical protein
VNRRQNCPFHNPTTTQTVLSATLSTRGDLNCWHPVNTRCNVYTAWASFVITPCHTWRDTGMAVCVSSQPSHRFHPMINTAPSNPHHVQPDQRHTFIQNNPLICSSPSVSAVTPESIICSGYLEQGAWEENEQGLQKAKADGTSYLHSIAIDRRLTSHHVHAA